MRLDLVGRLALGEDRLGRALAQLAVRVDAREAEVAEGQRAEPLQRGAGAVSPAGHRLEDAERTVGHAAGG